MRGATITAVKYLLFFFNLIFAVSLIVDLFLYVLRLDKKDLKKKNKANKNFLFFFNPIFVVSLLVSWLRGLPFMLDDLSCNKEYKKFVTTRGQKRPTAGKA